MVNIVKTEYALVLFADIVDSCRYSTVLGPLRYAKQLYKFREVFDALAHDHFRPPDDKCKNYLKIETRGDEGVVFILDSSSMPDDLVYRALQFAFELKGMLEVMSDDGQEKLPQPMKLGVGIHWGEVALITKSVFDQAKGRNTSQIVEISGYAINYAKRVESCSRIGSFSNIFVSKEVAFYLDGFPILLEKITTGMKGINDRDDVYEVRSAYFEKLPINPNFLGNDVLINKITHDITEYSMIRDPWQKSLAISILDTCLQSAPAGPSRELFQRKRHDLAWRNPAEDDPIILFLRAKQCEEECKYTQSIRYLRELSNSFPQFIHVKLKLMRVCWAVTMTPGESLDKLYARDVADEFLRKFPHYLTPEMKNICLEILDTDH